MAPLCLKWKLFRGSPNQRPPIMFQIYGVENIFAKTQLVGCAFSNNCITFASRQDKVIFQ